MANTTTTTSGRFVVEFFARNAWHVRATFHTLHMARLSAELLPFPTRIIDLDGANHYEQS